MIAYPEARDCSAHGLLTKLYAKQLERERRLHFGCDARCKLLTITPNGETLLAELVQSWAAYPTNSVADNDEQWTLEILAAVQMDWSRIRSGGVVEICNHEAKRRFKITQVEQDLTTGHVWRITIEPTGER